MSYSYFICVLQDGYQQRQPLLNSTSHHDSCSSDDDAGGANASGYTRRKSRPPKVIKINK